MEQPFLSPASAPGPQAEPLACGTRCRSVCLKEWLHGVRGGRRQGAFSTSSPPGSAPPPPPREGIATGTLSPAPQSSPAGRLRAAPGSRPQPGSSGKGDRRFGRCTGPREEATPHEARRSKEKEAQGERQRPGTGQAPAGSTSRKVRSRSRGPGLATGRWVGPGLPSVSRSPQPRPSLHACLSWFLTSTAGTPCVPNAPDQFRGAPGSLRVSVWGWGGLSAGSRHAPPARPQLRPRRLTNQLSRS